ncbi:MAG: hypothetical protein JW832_01315 [Deltaproteobacteria bacterium]|nr:hypothetical protein [Deltaproteobacteria bacterium]
MTARVMLVQKRTTNKRRFTLMLFSSLSRFKNNTAYAELFILKQAGGCNQGKQYICMLQQHMIFYQNTTQNSEKNARFSYLHLFSQQCLSNGRYSFICGSLPDESVSRIGLYACVMIPDFGRGP